MRERILIVDDTPTELHILRDMLQDDYAISVATTGTEALLLAEALPRPDIILLDIVMEGISGYEVCSQLKKNERTADIPVLFLTTLTASKDEAKGLELGAADYITKPLTPPIIKARIRHHLKLRHHQEHLEHLVEERTREIELTQSITIFSMACLAEMRDNELGGHIRRTQLFVKMLAEHIQGFPDYREYFARTPIDMLFLSTPLHDIGKIGIPDHILLKPGTLTQEEFAIMRLHTVYGHDTLQRAEAMLPSGTSFLRVAREIAHSHHEWWDGTGYPNGLSGHDIPVSGRIMAVADVYDALISKRVYKDPIAHHQAVDIICHEAGTHFDPAIVNAFYKLERDFRAVALLHADFEEERQCLLESSPSEHGR